MTSYLHAVTAITPMMIVFAVIAALLQVIAHLLCYQDSHIGRLTRYAIGNGIICFAFGIWQWFEPRENVVLALVLINIFSGATVATAYYLRRRFALAQRIALEAGKASAQAEALTDANEE